MSNLLFSNLYRDVLINPFKNSDANRLCIISGYGSSAMAFHHLENLTEINSDIKIKLILGMTASEGINDSNHKAFIDLKNNQFSGKFDCSYISEGSSVHSKLYIWLDDDKPILAFIGSANYSQTAFYSTEREVLTECNASDALKYFNLVERRSMYCDSYDIDQHILITKYSHNLDEETDEENFSNLESVKVSLLATDGSMHNAGGGLNWGQRPGREKNQAYIPLVSSVYRTDFFPEKTKHFTVMTDDNKCLICTRAQHNAKAIHTPHNNSLLGEYFRNRIGLSNGEFITKQHLINYGRTDVTFYKIDEETYFMDFSV